MNRKQLFLLQEIEEEFGESRNFKTYPKRLESQMRTYLRSDIPSYEIGKEILDRYFSKYFDENCNPTNIFKGGGEEIPVFFERIRRHKKEAYEKLEDLK